MSEIKVTDAITAVNPDKRVETTDPTHALIAAEAKKILDNPFVQEQVGPTPLSSTSFKLEVTLGGAKITLGARVIEDLTSKMPTSDLAPSKQEYIESCKKIIDLLDSTSEITPETEVLDLPTTPEKSEAYLKKIGDLEDIIEAQQGLFSQMEAEINRLLEADEKRKEIPISSNQVFKFGSLDEDASLEETLDGISGIYEQQIAISNETISHLREEITLLRQAQSDRPQHAEEFVASDEEHPFAYLGLQDGELDHIFESDDLPSQEELEIALLQEQVATLQQQNAEAVQSHSKLQEDLIAAIRLEKDLNGDLQESLENARDTLKEVLAEKKLQRPSFANTQLRERLQKAEAELELLRQQQFVIPKNISPRSSSVEKKLQAALESAQREVDSMREEIERQAEKFEAQIRQQIEKTAQLKMELQRSEEGRLHYESLVLVPSPINSSA